MKNKKRFFISAIVGVALVSCGLAVSSNQANAATYSRAITKIAGNGNYAIYHNVSRKGPSGKFTSTKYFKHGQIQSKKSMSTKKGTFWRIIVDGRDVGWVNQNFFARNKISVANEVSLVKNSSYAFPTRDAINYVTNSQGTEVDPSKVYVSQAHVSTKETTVNYSYGKAKASVKVSVYNGQDASADKTPKKGFKTIKTWNGGSKGSSRNWNAAHHYRSETTSNTFRSNGLTLRTRLFQPRFVSLGYGQAGDALGHF